MLLTKASEYALLSLAIISVQEEPINADKLSKQLNLSRSFLAKVLQNLAREGILNSYKGASGGFMLKLPKDQISIYTVVAISEDKLCVFECTGDNSVCPSGNISFCTLWPLLVRLQDKIDDFLKELTLEDLIKDIG